MRRLSILMIAALALACAHHAEQRPTPQAVEVQPITPPLTPEAAAFFGRAAATDTIGSVVFDLDELRAHRFITWKNPSQSPYLDLIISGLATLSNVMKDEKDGPLIARGAVLMALLREWNAWPSVQRIGVMLPWMKQEKPLEGLMIVMAVEGSAATNLELLKGMAAIDRVSGQPKPIFQMRDGHLCFAPPATEDGEAPPPVGTICAVAGPGYLLFASDSALDELSKPGNAPLPPPAFMRVHANVPSFGIGDVVVEWKAGVRFGMNVHATRPDLAPKIESTIQEFVKKLDEQDAETRANLQPMVDNTKKGLTSDPEAPAGLKDAASRLTVAKIVDPTGSYQAWRQSIHVTRTENDVVAEATLPETAVEQSLKQDTSLAILTAIGIGAAIAVPNFMKYKQRSTESEAKANLKAIYTAQKAFYAETDHYGKTFAEIGFMPEKGTKYTYCMAGKCLPCTAAGCFVPPPKKNPCIERTREYANDDGTEGFLACAVGDPENKHDVSSLDVWMITEDGTPEHVSEDAGD